MEDVNERESRLSTEELISRFSDQPFENRPPEGTLQADELEQLPEKIITMLAANTALRIDEVAELDYETYLHGKRLGLLKSAAFKIGENGSGRIVGIAMETSIDERKDNPDIYDGLLDLTIQEFILSSQGDVDIFVDINSLPTNKAARAYLELN